MGHVNKEPDEKILVSFADILSLFQRSKKTIFLCACIGSILAVLYVIGRPIRYEAEGTFREKANKTNNIPATATMIQLLSTGGLSSSGSESEAMSLIRSHKLLKEVVYEHHLQVSLEAIKDIETYFKLAKSNLKIAFRGFDSASRMLLPDCYCPLSVKTIDYSGELPLVYLLKLASDGKYELFGGDELDEFVGVGQLNQPFMGQHFEMTLRATAPQKSLVAQSFILQIDSLADSVKNLEKTIKIESSKLDKNLLVISCLHRNRYMASGIVNTIMDCYQAQLRANHNELALQQLEYLNLRREDLTGQLTRLMGEHADFLANDLYGAGFIESKKEMEFLAHRQHDYKEKLAANELEIKRLENLSPNQAASYDRYSPHEGDSQVLNTMFNDIRSLKQQRDTLEIELQKKALHQGTHIQQSFNRQVEELQEVQQNIAELEEISRDHRMNFLTVVSKYKLFDNPRFLFKNWVERLEKIENEDPTTKDRIKEGFELYLANLKRLFDVHKRMLQERLIHQQNITVDYQGITLPVATELYIEYSKQMIQIEANMRQNAFFIQQIEDPNFEITSLSAGLTDPISSEMVRKASELVLNLRDQNNQSGREHDRIRQELQLQKTFLSIHLKQMMELMELNKALMDEKIFALQNVSLELIHQHISLLEKNLQDYIQSKLLTLKQEKKLIEQYLGEIHDELAILPQKWVGEQLIEQEVANNQLIVEEIAKMVESKNIAHNLEVIQSAPVDLALPPVHPKSAPLVLWGLLGFLLGGGLSAGYTLGKNLTKGMRVSPGNLSRLGYHVSGKLVSPLKNKITQQLRPINQQVIKRLKTYFDAPLIKNPHAGNRILFLERKDFECFSFFLESMSKRHTNILTIDLREANSQNFDFLHYLEKRTSELVIRKTRQGDSISANREAFFEYIFLHKGSFEEFLEEMEIKYQWIMIVSDISPCSVDAESILSLFSHLAITLAKETIEELHLYERFVNTQAIHLSFILTDQ